MVIQAPFTMKNRRKKILLENIELGFNLTNAKDCEVAAWLYENRKTWSFSRVYVAPFPVVLGYWMAPFAVSVFPSIDGSVTVIAYCTNQLHYEYPSAARIRWASSRSSINYTIHCQVRVFPRSITYTNRDDAIKHPPFYEMHITVSGAPNVVLGSAKFSCPIVTAGKWLSLVHIGEKRWLNRPSIAGHKDHRKAGKLQTYVRNDGLATRAACMISNSGVLQDKCMMNAVIRRNYDGKPRESCDGRQVVSVYSDDIQNSCWINKSRHRHMMRSVSHTEGLVKNKWTLPHEYSVNR